MTAAERTDGRRWQLVVFDFDGTLADSFPWFTEVLNDVARRWRFRGVAQAEHASLRELDANEVLRHLGVPRWKVPLIAADLRRRMARDIERIALFDGVAQLLERLHDNGLSLAIASSNAAANVEVVLGPHLCRLVIDRECGAAIAGKADRLRRLLRRHRVSPTRAIYIGDELRDIDAARRVGLTAGAVGWGYNDVAVLRRRGPDLLFRDLAEIGDTLLGRGP
jgi:phosphoglycolate phosphatase